MLQIEYGDEMYDVPYYTFSSGKPGKHIVLLGGVHGDEINGVEVVSQCISYLKTHDLVCGQVTCIPVVNIRGYSIGKREITIDMQDLNRSFRTGLYTFTSSYAETLFEKILAIADIVIDIHDGGERSVLPPHSRFFEDDEEGVRMSHLLGTPLRIAREGKGGMMAVYLKSKGISSLTVEVGGNQEFNIEYHRVILVGLRRILYSFSMLEDIDVPSNNGVLSMLYKRRVGFKAHTKGIVTLSKELGDTVKTGDVVACFFDPIKQKKIDVISPVDGLVFSIWKANSVHHGAKIMAILVHEEQEVYEEVLADTAEYFSFEELPM